MNRYELYRAKGRDARADEFYKSFYNIKQLMNKYRDAIDQSTYKRFVTVMYGGGPYGIIIDDSGIDSEPCLAVIYNDGKRKLTLSFKLSTIVTNTVEMLLESFNEMVEIKDE